MIIPHHKHLMWCVSVSVTCTYVLTSNIHSFSMTRYVLYWFNIVYWYGEVWRLWKMDLDVMLKDQLNHRCRQRWWNRKHAKKIEERKWERRYWCKSWKSDRMEIEIMLESAISMPWQTTCRRMLCGRACRYVIYICCARISCISTAICLLFGCLKYYT